MHFQILGPLRVTNGDESEIALGGAKPAAVLAMLLLRPNEVIAADRLIEDLWDGRPPQTAAKTLQVHVSRLRRALGPGGNGSPSGTIETTAGGYVLRVEHDQIDARTFEASVAEGSAAFGDGEYGRASARLRAGLQLWRGEALADFAYASFAQDEIARLDGLRTVALESAIEAELALGRHTALIPELKLLVKRYPLSEHLRAQLMLALYRSGRQAEALGVYRVGRRILVDQLGIEPSEELRELEHAILSQDASLAVPERAPARSASAVRPRETLVGYERELSSIEELLECALTGTGGVVLVAGEPGVGKTRLADEVGAVARTRGARVVWGRCWNGGGAPAYWPWTQVLRELSDDREPPTAVAGVAGDNAEDGRFRLYESVAATLTRAADTEPLVIVLDDLHAADQATLSLLEFVAAASLETRILIVGTYRDSAFALERPLAETLAAVARVSDSLQLVLTGLSVDDTTHFVEVSAGVAPMPHLARAIHDASSGNPLFVSELVRLLQAEDRLRELGDGRQLVIPKGVDQVIERRLEHLPETCRRLLQAGAVIGREFDTGLLARIAEEPPAVVLEQLEPALAARLIDVSAENSSTARFTHELIRHALYVSLGVLERRRLHAAVAGALEDSLGTRAKSAAGVLAHHLTEAAPLGDVGKTVLYLDLAGDVAAEVSAPSQAAALYGQAAEIARANAMDPMRIRDLYLKQAEQCVLAPHLDETRAALAAAKVLAEAESDPVMAGRTALVEANLALHATCTNADLAAVEQLVDYFDAMADLAGASRALWVCSSYYSGMCERGKETTVARRMLDYARRSGSRSLLNRALRTVASSIVWGPTPASEAALRVAALREDVDDGTTRARMQVYAGMLEAISGRFDLAREMVYSAPSLAPPSERGGIYEVSLACGAHLELLAGNFRRAEDQARELNARYQEQGLVAYMASYLTFLVDALIGQGKLDEAAVHLGRAAEILMPTDVDAQFRQARSLARLELERGNLEEAEIAARRSLEWLMPAEVPDEQAEALLVLAAILRAQDRDDEATETAETALAMASARENEPLQQAAREFFALPMPARA